MASTRTLFDSDHDAFRDSVRRFVADVVVPDLDAWRASGSVPDEVLAQAGEFGLLGTAVPEEFGGGDIDDLRFTVVLVEEVMAVGATGLALLLAQHSGVVLPLLLAHGSDELKQQWLPGLAAGEVRVALVPAVPAAPATGSWSVDGTARGVAGAADADLLVVGADADGDVRLALVAADASGVTVEPVADALAGRESAQGDVTLSGLTGGAEALLGEGAAAQLQRDLDLWSAVLALAGARAVVAMTLEYVRERKVFGQPLARFENTRHRLAEVSASIETATAFVDAALQARGAGTLSDAQAATARIAAAATHDDAADTGLQLHGGYGYMREYPISHAFADARFLRLASATGADPREALADSIGL